jgi:hypothetical protein
MANTRITQGAEELVAAPHTQPVRSVQETGETGVARLNWRKAFERCSGNIPSERHTQGCPRVGRPFRTTSIDIETNEEQQLIDLKKFGVKIKGRYKDKSRLI